MCSFSQTICAYTHTAVTFHEHSLNYSNIPITVVKQLEASFRNYIVSSMKIPNIQEMGEPTSPKHSPQKFTPDAWFSKCKNARRKQADYRPA